MPPTGREPHEGEWRPNAMRIFLTISLLATLLVAVPATRADACSCALFSATEMIEHHDAAFVGTLIDRGTEIREDARFGQTIVFTFEVEQWVKGDLGSTIEVRSATDGAACGFEIPVGERAGIFLTQQGGEWSSGLCSTLPADVVLASLQPLEVGSTDPPFALLYGGVGPQRLLLIDAHGEVISTPPDPGEESWIASVSACPDGDRIIESDGSSIRFRTLPDLAIEEERGTSGDYLNRIWCRSGSEHQYVELVTLSRPNGELARLVDQEGKVFFEGRAWLIELVGDTAFVGANEGRLLVAIDLLSGESRVVYEMDATNDSGAIEGLVSDGSRLAFVATTYGPDRESRDLVVLDAATSEVLGTRPIGSAGSVRWVGVDLLAVSTYDVTEEHLLLEVPSLETVGRLPVSAGNAVLAGGTGVGVEQGTLLAIDGDEIRSVRSYPNAALWSIELLDREVSFDVPPGAALVEPAPDPAPTTTDTQPPSAAPETAPESAPPNPAPWLFGAAGLLAAGIAFAWRRRRA